MKSIIFFLIVGTILLMVACTQSSEPKVSQDEAIKIASSVIPANIVADATVSAKLYPNRGPNGRWQIVYENFEVAKDDLGWVRSSNVYPGPSDKYSVLIINVDAKDGTFHSMFASNGPHFGEPPSELPSETD